MSSLSLKKDIKNKLKNIILGFLIFLIYPALMMFFILMHRKYISEVPMLGFHTNMEIFKRAGIYYFYLLVIHIPLFLVWKKVISKIESLDFINTFYFGIAFSLCVFFLLTLPLDGHLALVPLLCVLFSFVFVFKFIYFCFKKISYFTWKKLIFIITTLLGICAGLAYIFFCLYYQLYIFDNYDFLGKFYNIPSYKRPLNFIF